MRASAGAAEGGGAQNRPIFFAPGLRARLRDSLGGEGLGAEIGYSSDSGPCTNRRSARATPSAERRAFQNAEQHRQARQKRGPPSGARRAGPRRAGVDHPGARRGEG